MSSIAPDLVAAAIQGRRTNPTRRATGDRDTHRPLSRRGLQVEYPRA